MSKLYFVSENKSKTNELTTLFWCQRRQPHNLIMTSIYPILGSNHYFSLHETQAWASRATATPLRKKKYPIVLILWPTES